MLYFQTPIIYKLPKKKFTDTDIKRLTLKYLDLCKTTREKTSEDKNGVFVLKDLQQLKLEILKQQRNIPEKISIKNPSITLSVKSSLFDAVMNKTGILGYYNPFTAESQYNPNLPQSQIPFTLAHEMSHQLGFAREQEASFIAYLSAKNSNNLDLQYSTSLYVLKSLLRALSTDIKNHVFIETIINQYSHKMKKDRANELEFMKNNEGILSDFFGITNDLFLRSNQQEGKITYSYFINLLIIYES